MAKGVAFLLLSLTLALWIESIYCVRYDAHMEDVRNHVYNPMGSKKGTEKHSSETLKEKASNAADSVKDGANNAAETVKDGANNAAETVKDQANRAAGTVTHKAKEAGQSVKDKTRNAAGTVKDKTNDAMGTLKDKLNHATGTMFGTGNNGGRTMYDGKQNHAKQNKKDNTDDPIRTTERVVKEKSAPLKHTYDDVTGDLTTRFRFHGSPHAAPAPHKSQHHHHHEKTKHGKSNDDATSTGKDNAKHPPERKSGHATEPISTTKRMAMELTAPIKHGFNDVTGDLTTSFGDMAGYYGSPHAAPQPASHKPVHWFSRTKPGKSSNADKGNPASGSVHDHVIIENTKRMAEEIAAPIKETYHDVTGDLTKRFGDLNEYYGGPNAAPEPTMAGRVIDHGPIRTTKHMVREMPRGEWPAGFKYTHDDVTGDRPTFFRDRDWYGHYFGSPRSAPYNDILKPMETRG